MRAAAWFGRIWERWASAFIRSPSLTLVAIVVVTAFAVIVGTILTPETNVNSIPFVIPSLIATFQGVRWVGVTSGVMLSVYVVLAFGVEQVPLGSAILTALGILMFGALLSWFALDRQRARNQSAELETMERHITLATRRSNVRLYSQDADLRYTWIPNPAPALSDEKLLGLTDFDLFPSAEAREMAEIKRTAMAEEREVHKEVSVTVSGEPRIYDLTVVPTYAEIDKVFQVSGVTCIAVDVTEMRQIISEREDLVLEQEETLAQAARAQENLERFTSMIAHDLLQPLTVIQGHVSLLRQWLDPSAPDRERRALDSLSRAVQQMRHLIDDLRDVAALEQGRFTLDPRPVDLVAMLRDVTSDFEGTAETHRINVHSPEYLWGHLDPSRISQLLGNLLGNAVKYSPDGGDIDVSLSVERNTCRIEVSDSGIGMSPEDFGALFEKFSRLRNSQSIQGLGLGLYICKGIAQAHGGDITVRSEPDVGSTFTIELPLGPRVEFERRHWQTGQQGERACNE